MNKKLTLSFENTENAFAYKSDKDLKKSYRIFLLMGSNTLVKVGSFLAPIALKLRLPIKWLIRDTIFDQFCGGEYLKEVAKTATYMSKYAVDCALDYGVEASAGEDNYDQAVKEFQTEIDYAGNHSGIPMISLKMTGIARTSLLEKYDRGEDLTKEEKEEWDRIIHRIDDVCRTAAQNNIAVLIDAEESWIQKSVDTLSLQMMRTYNKEKAIVYNTFQMYRKDRLEQIEKHWEQSKKENFLLGVKIVRGAYMEKERDRAEEKGYPSPIQPDKAATDHDFDAAIVWCIDRLDKLALFIGTHNEKSCMLAAKYLHQKGIPHNHPHVHFSQLFGMSDNVTFNLAEHGYSVSKYLPYGPIKDVLPYLIRRSQENSSISGQMGREIQLIKREIHRRKQVQKKQTT